MADWDGWRDGSFCCVHFVLGRMGEGGDKEKEKGEEFEADAAGEIGSGADGGLCHVYLLPG